jgi:hypothetical protein
MLVPDQSIYLVSPLSMHGSLFALLTLFLCADLRLQPATYATKTYASFACAGPGISNNLSVLSLGYNEFHYFD